MTHLEIAAGGLAVLSLALAPALVSPSADTGNVTGAAVHMKCGTQPEGTVPLLAIDGEIRGDAAPDSTGRPVLDRILDREDIFWLQIVCMDPRDSTFRRGGSGVGVISVWTKEGPAGQMEPALAEIFQAQERQFEHEGRYLEDLSAIEGFVAPDRIEIELEADTDFWVATARTERFLGRCTAGGGNGAAPGEPECADDR